LDFDHGRTDVRYKRGLFSSGERDMRTRLKEFRAKYGLTQEDLARRAGVRRETILFIENGKTIPSLQLAHAVARSLNTTIDELFIFDD
jgi:putative transcriptional regulator